MSYRRLLFALVGGGALAAVALVLGGYNVSAAAGHLPVVKSLLHWTMHNSVTVRARAPVPEDLASDARALAGAGHYDLVCRDCHAAPGEPLTAVARSLVPAPPHISDAVGEWRPQELFWIVKHGIKMTAMPAWPAQQRDDEVWSMVAFLLRLRELDPDGYRDMVAGALAAGERRPARSQLEIELARCARCHGYDGRGMDAQALPRIDGFSEPYLRGALLAFAEGRRASGIMQAHASAVPSRLLDGLARHYAALDSDRSISGASPQYPVPAEQLAQSTGWGQRVALAGVAERRVPACAGCHGPAAYARSAHYPVLAGQPAAYLETQLRLFRAGHRGGSAFAGIMTHVAAGLSDRDIRAVARYYAEL